MSPPDSQAVDEGSAPGVAYGQYAACFRDSLESLVLALRRRGATEKDAENGLLEVLNAYPGCAGHVATCRGPGGHAAPETRQPQVADVHDDIYAVRFVAQRHGCDGGTSTHALLNIETGVVVEIESWQPQVFLQGEFVVSTDDEKAAEVVLGFDDIHQFRNSAELAAFAAHLRRTQRPVERASAANIPKRGAPGVQAG